MSNVGLPDLIAESVEAYVEKAKELANDLEHLSDLRVRLRSMMANSPLMDAAGFTRNLEAAYQQMWHRWCEQGQGVLQAPCQGTGTRLIRTSSERSLHREARTLHDEGRPRIRILHQMSRSGGTIISKCLGCMKDLVLLSETHPSGTQWFNPLHQASEWFNILTNADLQDLQKGPSLGFEDLIDLLLERSKGQNKTLVLRDWSHLDFIAIPFLEKASYRLSTAEVLSHSFEVTNTATVRHPVDQWLSLESLQLMRGQVTLEAYLRGYVRFAEYCNRIGFIRYEDFTRSPAKQMERLCERLSVRYDPSFMQKWWKYTKITGDTNSQRGPRREIRPLPPRKIPGGLLEKFEKSPDYIRSIEILGYEHPK
jgi:hypothetical protein